jgi:hypothetical protein
MKHSITKNYIDNYIKYICDILDIPLPILEYYDNDKDIYFKYLQEYKEYKIIFNLGELCNITRIKNDRYIFKKFIFNSIKKRVNFIVCHELGHYYLHYKFLKHSIKLAYNDDWEKTFTTQIEYRKLRSEYRADKIALYLTNKA